MKNTLKLAKLMLQLTFNPGLTLTGFRTTRPWLVIKAKQVVLKSSAGLRDLDLFAGFFTVGFHFSFDISFYLSWEIIKDRFWLLKPIFPSPVRLQFKVLKTAGDLSSVARSP